MIGRKSMTRFRVAVTTGMAAGLCLLAAVSGCSLTPKNGGTDAGKKKVLVVMLDGLRADILENGAMPNLRRLMDGKWQPGYGCRWSLTARTVPDAKPSSAANHTSIATGATPTKTGIFYNGMTRKGNFKKWPTFLSRIAGAFPEAKTAFAFSWDEDKFVGPDPKVEFHHATDAENAERIPAALAAADGPDATLYFIDVTDHSGHVAGFYPYSHMYLEGAHTVDGYVGRALDAIASRKTFEDEDWLVVVTSDHGGYSRVHGIWGGHCTTIPFLVVSKGGETGELAGRPANYDAAALALEHFGLYGESLGIDGRPLPAEGGMLPARGTAKKPVAHFKFEPKKPAVNALAGGLEPLTAPDGSTAVKGSENLEYENGDNFTVAFWAKMDKPAGRDPAIVANKDWTSGLNPGVAITAGTKTDWVKKPGICLNAALPGKKRIDMGTYDIDYVKWCFYAATKTPDGKVEFYQGGRDGRLYWMAETAKKLELASGMPWRIKQDGTGKYPEAFAGEIREFALWTRSLHRDDIRKLYEAGRNGVDMQEALAK